MDEKSKDAWRIFVLADTHNRLPASVGKMAKDADEIWHLGDVARKRSSTNCGRSDPA